MKFPGDKPTGKKRIFLVTLTKEVTLIIDESVIAQGLADDGLIMKNPSEDEVIKHLAFNLVSNQLLLNQIDGYANCPDDSAEVKEGHTSVEFYETAPSRKKR